MTVPKQLWQVTVGCDFLLELSGSAVAAGFRATKVTGTQVMAGLQVSAAANRGIWQ